MITKRACVFDTAWDQSEKFMKLYVTLKGVVTSYCVQI